MCNATAVTALVTENTGKSVSASTCLPVVIKARPPQTSTTGLPSTEATTCRPISPRLLMAASRASWTMLFGFVAIVLPPAPSWSRRYVPAYTTFLLKKRHPCLYHSNDPVVGPSTLAHRPLHRRYCRGAKIRARLEARLDHRGDDHDVAGGVHSGGPARAVRRGLYWLGRHVCDRACAGGIEPADPRLGSRIAALADPRGPP